MAISHLDGIAVANISHLNGITKANISAVNGITASFAGGADSDATAFLTATGITDPTISDAIDDLVVALKGYSIWTKMSAIYPFVGGTSTTHSYNLKNTAAYQITWNGTVTHNANGITGNGSTGYGNTGLNANTALTLNSTHLSLYCRTTGANEVVSDFGCYDGGTNRFLLEIRISNLFRCFQYDNSSGSTISVANTDAQGFYIASRRANNDFEGYKNGASVVTQTSANGGTIPSANVFICARNVNGTASQFTSRNYSFASIGAGLTDTEAANFNTAVEAFQDALSRGVV
jgi:hypothetical protein